MSEPDAPIPEPWEKTSPEGAPPPALNGYAYPLYLSDLRRLEEDYEGLLVLCDIDNTYLVTTYDSLRDFVRLAFEPAQAKQPVPGAPKLLQALRHGAEGPGTGPRRPIYFVSASPQRMRAVLQQRLALDEVEYDGASFRDLWAGRTPHLRHIKDIYGYKIAALLSYRARHPARAREVLFGDDLEHDTEAYVLYARICSGEIRGPALDGILEARGLLAKDRRYIVALAEELPEGDPVQHIFIRRVPKTRARVAPPPSPFDARDARVKPFDDFLQPALVLYAEGELSRDVLEGIARSIDAQVGDQGWLENSLACARSLLSGERRDRIDVELCDELRQQTGRALLGALPTPKPETEDSPVTETPKDPAPETKAEETPAGPSFKPEIEFDDFMKLDMRVATVKTCDIVEGADRLLKLELDVEGTTRTVVSGIRAFYEAESLVGTQVIYLANLKPRKLRGIMSQGMVLAATDDGKAKLLRPESACAPGAPVS